MKLPEPVAHELSAVKFANGNQLVYTVPATLSSYVKAEPLYSEAQVIATFEPVLKQALEAMEGADEIDCDMRDSIDAIRKLLNEKVHTKSD